MTKGRKLAIAAVIVIILIIAAGTLLFLPELNRSGVTQPSSTQMLPGPTTETPPATFVIPRETEPWKVPPSGVWVHIRYLGSWNATYGMPGALQTTENSGERYFEIPNAAGKIELAAGKLDSSASHPLVVEIVKDGIILKNGSTMDAGGQVLLSAEVGGMPPALTRTTAALTGTDTTIPVLTITPVTTSSAGRTPAPITTALICPSDLRACGANCTDLLTDNTNCGDCGISCPAGKFCLGGTCTVTCSADQTSCPDGCFNINTHARHCGSCDTACPNGLICFMGRCDSPATPMPVPQ